MNWMDMTLGEFQDALASSVPTPGGGTAAAVALSIRGGADIVRVHDVKEMVRVAKMSDAIVRGSGQSGHG